MPATGKKHNPFYQAQAILARRDHAEAEVRQKLARKGFSQEQIEEAITFLYEQKLLNDEKFARTYVESILMGKAVGPKWLQFKLKQRGVAPAVIEEAISQAFTADREEDLARQALESWSRLHPTRIGDKGAVYRFLASRGFSIDTITQVLEVPTSLE